MESYENTQDSIYFLLLNRCHWKFGIPIRTHVDCDKEAGYFQLKLVPLASTYPLRVCEPLKKIS